MPAVALQPSQPHTALIWLIRGTGAFIAGASLIIGCCALALIAFAAFRAHLWDFIGIFALLLLLLGLCGIRLTRAVLAVILAIGVCYFFGCLLVTTLHGQPPSVNFGWFGVPLFVLGSLALMWLLGVIFWLSAKSGYDMWRKVDKIAAANFASVFALFAARVFHYFLPGHLPPAVNEHLSVHFRDPFNDRGTRMLWTWLALYLFYKLIKACLLQILELNPPNLPQNPPSIDPDAPEFPRKSPLVQM
jgi:hypothetical protein